MEGLKTQTKGIRSAKHKQTMPETALVARVYLVRHGETQANRDGVIQGQLDTVLNARGEEQARMVANALGGVGFTRAYSSDLRRASEVCVPAVAKGGR